MAHPELRDPFDRVDLSPGAGATLLMGHRPVVVERVLVDPDG